MVSAIRLLRALFAWACLAALVYFMIVNGHTARVELFGMRLEAPLSVIVLLAALLGAVGASSFRTLLRWSKIKKSS